MELLSTKLMIPQPRKNYIRKSALFEAFNKISEHRLTILHSGPGTGKSTAVSSYINEKNLKNTKWISVDESSNNLFLFWGYIITALSSELNTNREDYMNYFNGNPNTDAFYEVLIMLMNSLNTDDDIIVVIDDFHYITDKKTLDIFQFFISNINSNYHFVILTREPFPLYLPELKMQNQIQTITTENFRLTRQESLAFLKYTLSYSPDKTILEKICTHAEGWIGGLQILASSPNHERPLDSFSSKDSFLREYLTEEIFCRLSADEQEFLIHTSILNYFNKEVCSKLIPRLNYSEVLDSLLNQNLLIYCIDEKACIYRYHNIFSSYLRTLFHELDQEEKEEIQKKAAYIHIELGDYEEGIQLLLSIPDYPAAIKAILTLPITASSFAYLYRVPVAYAVENFDFAFQKFFYHYTNLEYDICKEIYDQVMPKIKDKQLAEAFEGASLFYGQDTSELNVPLISPDQLKNMKINGTTKALILLKNAAFLYYKDQFHDALDYVNESLSYIKDNPNLYIEYLAYGTKSQVLEELGRLKEAAALNYTLKEMLGKRITAPSFYANYYVTITGIHLKQMQLEEAERSLAHAHEYIDDEEHNMQTAYQYNMSEYLFLSGRAEESIHMIERMFSTNMYHNNLVMSGLLKYLWKAGALSPSYQDDFINEITAPDKTFINLNNRMFYTRLLQQFGRQNEAMHQIDDILSHCRQQKIYYKITEASLLKLFLIQDMNKSKRLCIDLFREALYYGSEYNIRLPFFFEDQTVRNFVHLLGSEIVGGLSAKELNFYNEIFQLCGCMSDSLLSSRELEVLKAIASGNTNKEISEQLFISLATVKSHIINIYRKLEVNSRTAAIKAAQDTNLL